MAAVVPVVREERTKRAALVPKGRCCGLMSVKCVRRKFLFLQADTLIYGDGVKAQTPISV